MNECVPAGVGGDKVWFLLVGFQATAINCYNNHYLQTCLFIIPFSIKIIVDKHKLVFFLGMFPL